MAVLVHKDRAFASRVLAGDEAALRELFDRFFPRLYRYALVRLDGDEDAAAEVVQQALCKGLENLAGYRGEAALYAWFCRICHNALVDHCRRRKRELAQVVLLAAGTESDAALEALTAPMAGGPEAEAHRREGCRLVQATLDLLPGHYGDVLEWKYVEGLSVDEIAGRLRLGYKAAESLLSRARAAFPEAILTLSEAADHLPAGRGR